LADGVILQKSMVAMTSARTGLIGRRVAQDLISVIITTGLTAVADLSGPPARIAPADQSDLADKIVPVALVVLIDQIAQTDLIVQTDLIMLTGLIGKALLNARIFAEVLIGRMAATARNVRTGRIVRPVSRKSRLKRALTGVIMNIPLRRLKMNA